jgi:hypothetical protein
VDFYTAGLVTLAELVHHFTCQKDVVPEGGGVTQSRRSYFLVREEGRQCSTQFLRGLLQQDVEPPF